MRFVTIVSLVSLVSVVSLASDIAGERNCHFSNACSRVKHPAVMNRALVWQASE